MANHKISFEITEKHSKEINQRPMWNINNIHDARAMIRHYIGIANSKKQKIKAFHNNKLVYDSENPTNGYSGDK